MGFLLGFDPRLLVDHDPGKPWSNAERSACAIALSQWWQRNHDKPLLSAPCPIIQLLTMTDMARMMDLTAQDGEKRRKLLDLISAAWMKKPAVININCLARILLAGKDHAGLIAAVSKWPVEGPAATILATWHLMHDDSEPFDALFSAALRPKYATGRDHTSEQLQELISISFNYPSISSLSLILHALKDPLDTPFMEDVWFTINRFRLYGITPLNGTALETLLETEWTWKVMPAGMLRQLKEKAKFMQLAILSALLKDNRLAPAWMTASYDQFLKAPGRIIHNPRVCDVELLSYAQTLHTWFHHLDVPDEETRLRALIDKGFFLPASEADRDILISDLRALINGALPGALKAAGMPAMPNGVTDLLVGADDKPAF